MKFIRHIQRHAIPVGVSVLMTLVMLCHSKGWGWHFDFVTRLETYAYDVRLKLTMPHGVDRRVVIVDLDERSLQEQGHWPWSRNKMAQLVDLLFDRYKINVLGFDVVFAESDESSGLRKLEALAGKELSADAGFKSTLNRIKPQLDYDQLFANSLQDRRVALGYYFRVDAQGNEGLGALPQPALKSSDFRPDSVDAIVATGYVGNLPQLQKSAPEGGFFSHPLVDEDGVFRRAPLLQMYKGQLYESLALAMVKMYLRTPTIQLAYESEEQTDYSLAFLKLAGHWVPVDSHVATLIPFRGPEGSFRYVSATDVLRGKVDREVLDDAIVLIGSTAPGLKDMRATPMQQVYAGVEMHANVIAGILDRNIKQRSPSFTEYEFGVLLLIGLLLAFAFPGLAPWKAFTLSFVVVVSVLGVDAAFWSFPTNQILPLAGTLLLVSVLFVFNMVYGFFIENRSKRLLGGLFGQYVPPELVDEMAKDPGAYSLAGESRELTVLFADVRGFTTISEGLNPTQLTQLMNEYLTPMTHVIQKHRGTIDKYMGDAIMAFWGAPVHDPNHARLALLAGMEMLARLETLQDHFKAKGWPPIRIGVGLNTGEMTVGNMGSEFRLAYTVMGDAVNLGSRLEGLTKEYGVQMMVSEFTRAAVPDFVYRELDCVRVKGKDKPVAIFEPICPLGSEPAGLLEELALYGGALALYRQQNWVQAEEKFAELQNLYPQRYLYQVYAKRITYLCAEPPGVDWDGAFTFTTK